MTGTSYDTIMMYGTQVLAVLVQILSLVAVLRWPASGAKKLIVTGLLFLMLQYAGGFLLGYLITWYIQNQGGGGYSSFPGSGYMDLYRMASIALNQAGVLAWLLIALGLWHLRKPLAFVQRAKQEGDERIDF